MRDADADAVMPAEVAAALPRVGGQSLRNLVIRELLGKLSKREQRLLFGHAFEGLDYRELSAELGPTAPSLRRAMSRILHKLRRAAGIVARRTCDVVMATSLLAGSGLLAQPFPLDSSEFQVNTHTTDLQIAESVAFDAGGNFVITWRSDGSAGSDTSGSSIQARRYRRDGSPLDQVAFQVNVETWGQQRDSAVAMDSAGNFVVVWNSDFCAGDSGNCVHFRRFDASSAALDPADIQANFYTDNVQWRPAVAAASDGSFVVVWESRAYSGTDNSGTSIQARRFRADGTPLDATEFQVNTYTTQFQLRPDVAVTPAGDFVVVWESVWSDGDDYLGIQGRRFAADGTPLDATELQVNSYSIGIQASPKVAMAPNGDFVVAWESFGSAGGDTSELSVQARRFKANGVALDPADFQVNTYTTSYQDDVDVALNAEGNFVVVWESWGSPGNDQDISSVQVRRYRRDGSAIDPVELQVNTLTTEEQGTPAIGVGVDGDFVVAWYSSVSSGSDNDVTSIQARRFGRPTLGVTSTSGGTGGPGCTLRDALATANSGVATGGCPAGNEGGVIELPEGATIALSEIDNGTNALPVVERSITVRGRGGRIERDPGLACPLGPEFRLFEVADGGVLTLEDVVVSNGCLASAAGGGVLASGGTLVLRAASIEGNEAGSDGAGVAVVDGNLLALDSTVRGNLAGGFGGGISIAGVADLLYVSGSTVSENAAVAGGGLYLASAATLLVRNSTVSGNLAAASGGGIEIDAAGATLGLDFVTVTGNSASVGAGVSVAAGELALHGSLSGDNFAGADCAVGAGTVTASGANLDTDGSCAALAGSGVATVAALGLGPLAQNGGATRTHLPLAASPALDTAPLCATRSGAALGVDQRGYRRPTDDDGDTIPECDLGAAERGPLFFDGFESGDLDRWSMALRVSPPG